MIMDFLRRYTELPFLIHMLKTKKITLLNPNSWDDRNDAFLLEEYRRRKKLKTLLALCFSEASETYHHWRVFSGSSGGVCIVFFKTKIITWIKDYDGLRYDSIKYCKIKELKKKTPKLEELPFLKRHPFRDEKEFRLLYEDNQNTLTVKNFELDFNTIRRIVLSPWLPKSALDSVKSVIKNIDNCGTLEVGRTTLVDNEQWKNAGSVTV